MNIIKQTNTTGDITESHLTVARKKVKENFCQCLFTVSILKQE